MATRQHLINLHGTVAPTAEGLKDKEFKNGELAVQHGADAASSALHILTSGRTELVTFLPKGQDTSYLGASAKAADSAKLGGELPSHYAIASDLTALTTRVTNAETEIKENAQAATKASATNAENIGLLDGRLDTAESEIDALQAKTMVDSFGGKTGAITLDTDASADKSVKFSMKGNELQGTVNITIPGHQIAAKTVKLIGDVTGEDTATVSGDTLSIATSIAANAITTTELAGNAVEAANIKNGAVTDEKIATVSATKLTGAIAPERLPEIPNTKLTGIADWAKASTKPSYKATDISYSNTNVGAKLDSLSTAVAGGSHFIGVTTGDLSTTNIVTDIYTGGHKPAVGDFVIKEVKEYIFSKNAWVELGDTSAESAEINKIKNGTTVVGKATADASGNTITETYATKTALSGKADSVHKHSGADITSGTVGFAYLPTGTSETTVAVGNHTHTHAAITDFDSAVKAIKVNAATDADKAANATNASYAAHIGTNASHPQIGSGVKPVYVASDGTVTASNSTVGASNKAVYLNNGEITAMSGTYGGANQPVYINAGTITPCNSYPTITVSGDTSTVGKVLANVTPDGHKLTFTEQAVVYNDAPVNFKTMTIDCGEY